MMEKQVYLVTGKRWCLLLLITGMLLGCKSEYQQYVDKELASGVTEDSLIFGMRMGQTKKDFYTICWELNRQQKIMQGSGNKMARYNIDKDTLGQTSNSKEVMFYGIFDKNDVMRGMDMRYSYNSWAPWNREKHADSLMQRLRKQYLVGYPGNDFIEIEVDGLDHPAMVKIDGNRQILMYPKDTKDVVVKIEDLRYKLKHNGK